MPAGRGVTRRRGEPAPLRFEWERVVRSCVDMHVTVKAVAYTLATYGDLDGLSIRPGNDALVADSCTSDKTVRRAVGQLRELGLIERVVCGSARGRAGVADEYRLCIPVDLHDRMRVRLPNGTITGTPVMGDQCSGPDHRSPVTAVRDRNTGHMGPRTPVMGDRPPPYDQLKDQTLTSVPAELDGHDELGGYLDGRSRRATEVGQGHHRPRAGMNRARPLNGGARR